jgi:uncharacterized protein (TIGR00369 family)
VTHTNFDIHIPFVEHLGLEPLERANGTMRLRFAPRPEHLNSWNGIHGGVLMSLLDVALSSAARSLDVSCIGAATVELKTNFLAAATDAVLGEGRAQRAGRSLIFAEGELRSADGTLVAKGTGTFKLIYPANAVVRES